MVSVEFEIMGQQDERLDSAIREYFGSEGLLGHPICQSCGCDLDFEMDYGSGPKGIVIRVTCSQCGTEAAWTQTRPRTHWEDLHLAYFAERYRFGEAVRCPFDDCFVTVSEFGDGQIEFRCLYCNRAGKTEVDLSGVDSSIRELGREPEKTCC